MRENAIMAPGCLRTEEKEQQVKSMTVLMLNF